MLEATAAKESHRTRKEPGRGLIRCHHPNFPVQREVAAVARVM